MTTQDASRDETQHVQETDPERSGHTGGGTRAGDGDAGSLTPAPVSKGGRQREGSVEGYGAHKSHDGELEQALIGAVMVSTGAADEAFSTGLARDDFYVEAHRLIFDALHELYVEGATSMGRLDVKDKLQRSGVLEEAGGVRYLGRVAGSAPHTVAAGTWAHRIRGHANKRRLLDAATRTRLVAEDERLTDVEALAEAESLLSQVSDRTQHDAGPRPSHEWATEALDYITERADSDDSGGVLVGLTDVDALLGGIKGGNLAVLAARPSMGKSLGRGTPVLMYDGRIKKVEDVRVGDLVAGDDGTPRKVLALGRGRETMYWIRQVCGMDYRVNEGHILSLTRVSASDDELVGTRHDIEILDYLAKPERWREDNLGYKVAVDYPEYPLDKDPYTVGLEAGYAALCAAGTSPDIQTQLMSCERTLGVPGTEETYKSTGSDANEASTATVARSSRTQPPLLADTHVYRHHGGVPCEYLINSKSNRLQLLAGLVDAVGCYPRPGGPCEIALPDKDLLRQAKRLCDGLGLATSLESSSVPANAHSAWRLRFAGNVDEIPVRDPEKRGQPWTGDLDWRVTSIEVQRDRVDNYYGFTLDGNGRFLLEDGTVTHNTAFALNAARNVAGGRTSSGRPDDPSRAAGVMIFSLEMSRRQMANRLISTDSRIPSEVVASGALTNVRDGWDRVTQSVSRMSNLPIWIDDSPGLRISEIRARVRIQKARMERDGERLGLVVIDYLQLLEPEGSGSSRENRNQEVSAMSRSIKGMAREFDVGFLVLAQLSRAVEQRHDKHPMLSDLRDSGAVEQDADMVMFLYREDYYERGDNAQASQNVAEVDVAKHRDGPTGKVSVSYARSYGAFGDLARGETHGDGGVQARPGTGVRRDDRNRGR